MVLTHSSSEAGLLESIDVLNAVLNGGQLAFMVWLVIDMRRQQEATDAKIWALLEYLARERGIEPDRIVG